jgi:Nickel responsive protein SCO4226-like
MPRYIIERDVGEVDLEALGEVGRKSNEVIDDMDGIVWIRSYISEAEGKIYCEYEAPNPEAVYEHARRTGLPVTNISEIAMEVDPSMFR